MGEHNFCLAKECSFMLDSKPDQRQDAFEPPAPQPQVLFEETRAAPDQTDSSGATTTAQPSSHSFEHINIMDARTHGAPPETPPSNMAASVAVQRDPLPPVPNYQLTPPSFGQPTDPASRYRLGGDLTLRLDPQIQAMIQQHTLMSLQPGLVSSGIAGLGRGLPALTPSSTPGGSSVPPAATSPTPASTPSSSTPGSSATPPAPRSTPEPPRPGSVGDIFSAIAAYPTIQSALTRLQTEAEAQALRDWNRLRTGERVVLVSSGIVIAVPALGFSLADPTMRAQLGSILNGTPLPVPGVPWLHLETNLQSDSFMVGFHLDLGRLLAPVLPGFGPGSPNAIGGPPQPEPFPTQRAIQREAQPGGQGETADLGSRIQARLGGGSALEPQMQARFSSALGHDLSNVRIHHDHEANALSQAVSARAFTTGNDIFFRDGAYNPGSSDGQRLLAHELTHTVQQARGPVSGTPTAGGVSISDPGDAFEREAEHQADQLMNSSWSKPTPALPLQPAMQAGSRGFGLVLQRAVDTIGGSFDTDEYATESNASGKEIGVRIDLKFTPRDPVNATKIGMVQMVNSMNEGTPTAINPTVGAHSIPSTEAGAGNHIDRLPSATSPIYGTGNSPTGSLTDAPAWALNGATTPGANSGMQYGWHYTDTSGAAQHQDAHLGDTPKLPNRGNNASQIFETTAVALEGTQANTYYGSVQWGWRTDAAGTFTRLPLTIKSFGVPSATFRRAAELWNAGTNDSGDATVDLPGFRTLQPTPGTEGRAITDSITAGDFATVYQILNGMWIRPMLTTLTDLSGQLATLFANLGQAVGVNVPRLTVAMEAVRLKTAGTALSDASNIWLDPLQNPGLVDQIDEVNDYLGRGTYTVRSGDNLSKIARELYGEANRWREIYNLNRDRIHDPNLIHPGQVLRIPSRNY
jgi:nucleoid-associated protein YgaU